MRHSCAVTGIFSAATMAHAAEQPRDGSPIKNSPAKVKN
jgi:hypothetical protein